MFVRWVRARSAVAVLVLVVAGVAGAGCGDRDEPGPATAGRPGVPTVRDEWSRSRASRRRQPGTCSPAATRWPAAPRSPSGSPIPQPAPRSAPRCYYLDLEAQGGWVSGFGGCGGADDQVTLNRNSEIVFGTVGRWPAVTVRISRGGPATDVTVTGGWFLVPQSLTGGADASYSIVLVGADGETLCAVHDLTPPASVTPVT